MIRWYSPGKMVYTDILGGEWLLDIPEGWGWPFPPKDPPGPVRPVEPVPQVAPVPPA